MNAAVAPAQAGTHKMSRLGGVQLMSAAGSYFVYILASAQHGTLYIGVTRSVPTRLELHRAGRGSKFAQQYKVYRLVYVETYATAREAIAR